MLVPPRRNEYFTQNGELTLRAAKYLESLSNEVNNVVNNITTTATDEMTSGALSTNIQESVEDEAFSYYRPQISSQIWSGAIKTESYYASPWDYVEARTKNIYLPQFPDQNDQVVVASDYGQNVVIFGNGNKIKIKSELDSVEISRRGNSFHFIYFIDNTKTPIGGYWRIK